MAQPPRPGQGVKIELINEKLKSLLAEDGANGNGAVPLETSLPAFFEASVVEASDMNVTLAPQGAGWHEALATGGKAILHYHDENGLYLLLARVMGVDAAGGTVAIKVQGLAQHQRRKYARREADLPVRYRLLPADGTVAGDWIEGKAPDVSVGGLKLVGLPGLDAGQDLEVVISLPGHTVEARGRITRTWPGASHTSAGVRFTEASEADREAIHRFVWAQLGPPPQA